MTHLTRRTLLVGSAAALVAGRALAAPAIPAPEAGKGLIVFYRGGTSAGMAARFTIEGPSGVVGEMKQGAVLFAQMPPGEHLFRVPEANSTEGVIPVKAGETIYIRCYLDAATNAGKLQFQVVDEARAMKDMRNFK